MDAIFHERQEGSLCAQHCLNSLLQGPYFSAVDLADIGRELDEAERATMAEGDVNSPEYLRFLQQPSSNMDDSGYFSVQVIGRALKVWGLELVPFGSTEAVQANIHPEREKAFICNFKDHWLTIRKLGQQWFNLNSLLTGPELISDMYLGMFLIQLQKEGYSIFVVRGPLPENEADQLLNLIPAVQTHKPRLLTDLSQQQQQPRSTGSGSTSGAGPSGKGVFSLQDLQTALQSNQRSQPGGGGGAGRLEGPSNVASDESLAQALKMSMQEMDESPPEEVDVEDLRRKRQAFFDKQHTSGAPQPPTSASSKHPEEGQYAPSSGSHPQGQALPDNPSGMQAAGLEARGGQTYYPTPGAVGHSLKMEEETYVNDEQMTEEAMLEIAIQMSLGGTQQAQHQQGSGS
ncbi:ataxin-3-like [Acanthaster planci]|uniref:Ataxin-3 homolog n=1 Tax=Acanthaster planci TaxID=133434 RepID=A0A8B7YT70_ACAPL|nr:ataxin-3-like [Acanthaster planci]